MDLVYTNAEQTSIQATLDDKETLGNLTGPGVFFIPTDPANAEYAEIVANGYKVEEYVAPTPPPPEAVDLPPVMPTEPTHAAPKAYVDQEIAALAARVETLERRR